MKWISGTDVTPEKLAEALRTITPAQRRAVLRGTIGGLHGSAEGRGYWALRNGLMSKGLMTTANRIPVLTNLGRAVQVELLKRSAA